MIYIVRSHPGAHFSVTFTMTYGSPKLLIIPAEQQGVLPQHLLCGLHHADSLILTDTPVTKDHLSSEYAEIFADCSVDEMRSIIKVASEYKSMLQKKL